MKYIMAILQPIYKLRVKRVLNKYKDKIQTWKNITGFGPLFSKDYVVLKNKVYVEAFLEPLLTGTPKFIYGITSIKNFFKE